MDRKVLFWQILIIIIKNNNKSIYSDYPKRIELNKALHVKGFIFVLCFGILKGFSVRSFKTLLNKIKLDDLNLLYKFKNIIYSR